jgi:hypothetical protein
MSLDKYPADFQAAAKEQINLYNRATAEPEDPFGDVDWGALFAPSEQETELLGLQIQQIKSFVEAQDKLTAREEARRAAYERYQSGGAFTAANIEEQQGQLAARAAQIAEIEQGRLKDALDGKLPVSPSTERAIAEGKSLVDERNIRDFGQLGTSSTPALERQQRFDESAEILKDVDRKGYIERGIQPSVNAATFAAQKIGEYVPGEIPGAATALQGLRQNRQAAASTMASLAGAQSTGDRGAQYGLASSGAYGDQTRAMAAAAEKSSGIGGMAGGLGALVGGIGGAIAGGWWNFGVGAVPGWAVGASLGAGLGAAAGSAAGSLTSSNGGGGGYTGGGGGLSGLSSLYSGGGGYKPYSKMAYGGPSNTTFPYP